MSRSGRLVLAAILALTIAAHGLHAQPEQPVVHLLAPSYEALQPCDALAAETGLRLLAMDLAANHGIYAKYWPVDQQERIPDTAYPRITMEALAPPPMTHVRLERTGNVFWVAASFDGQHYLCHGHYTLELPSKVHVGAYLHSHYGENERAAVISNIRLYGAPLGDDITIGDLGECHQSSDVERDGDQWLVHTYGYNPTKDHPDCGICEHGAFISVEHEGDFVLEADIKDLGPDQSWSFAGVMCRAALTCDADTIGTYVQSSGQSCGMLRDHSYVFKQWLWDPSTYTLSMTLLQRDWKHEALGLYPISGGCWDALCRSVDGLSVSLRSALYDKLNLDVGGNQIPADKASLATDHSATLDEARSLTLAAHEGSILAASRKVDSVLNEMPWSARAHYTAALCGSIMACHDLYGGFHERPRYLAGPFAHWLLARRLGKTERPEDIMSGAWLMLACGYPNAALSVAQSLSTNEQATSEVRALKTFVTRDYRRPETDSILDAPPIEQLAWLWASQECGNDVPLRDTPIRMAMARKSCAFLPMYGIPSVGSGHTSTVLGLALAYGADAFNLLKNTGLPDSDCKSIAQDMARMWDLPPEDDIGKIADSVWSKTVMSRQGGAVPGTIAPLMALYDLACRQPVGPTPEEEGFAWRCLPPHDYADILRGRFLRLLNARASFVGCSLGAPEYGNAFCREVAEGLASMPDAADYFKAAGFGFVRKHQKSRSLYANLANTPFGRNPVVLRKISRVWTPPKIGTASMPHGALAYGRGCWDRSDFTWVANNYGYEDIRNAMAFTCASLDSHSTRATEHLYWLTLGGPAASLGPGRTLCERMPYNLSILRTIATGATQLKKQDLAIQMNEKLISIAPDDVSAYWDLANLCYKRDEKTKAIGIVKQAVKNCEYTVVLSNLMGRGATWLADEGQLEEALELGKTASLSCSATGLGGYAYAQEANGMIPGAFTTYRSMAHGYYSSSDEFLEFLFEHDFSDEEILAEIEALLETHEETRTRLKDYILFAFRRHAGNRAELMKKALAGPLEWGNHTEIAKQLFYYHMCARSYTKALQSIGALRTGGRSQVSDVILSYIAAVMCNDAKQKGLKSRVQRPTVGSSYDASIGLIAGRLPAEAALEQSKNDYDKLYTYLLIGVMAEKRGDLAAARDAYEKGSKVEVSDRAIDMALGWAAYLKDVEAGEIQYVGPESVPKQEEMPQEEVAAPIAEEKRAPALPLIAGGIGIVLLLSLGAVLWLKSREHIP